MPEGVPAGTVWPRSLTDPDTWSSVNEFATAVRAVHEAAHAVVAAQLGLTVVRVWVGDADEREAGDPATATGITEYAGRDHGDAGVIVALAAWPANMHQLRLLRLDNDANLAGFGAAMVHDRAAARRIHAADHPDCPGGRCDQVARLADTAADMARQHWGQIMTVAHRLAAAGGHLDYPDIPTTAPVLQRNERVANPLAGKDTPP